MRRGHRPPGRQLRDLRWGATCSSSTGSSCRPTRRRRPNSPIAPRPRSRCSRPSAVTFVATSAGRTTTRRTGASSPCGNRSVPTGGRSARSTSRCTRRRCWRRASTNRPRTRCSAGPSRADRRPVGKRSIGGRRHRTGSRPGDTHGRRGERTTIASMNNPGEPSGGPGFPPAGSGRRATGPGSRPAAPGRHVRRATGRPRATARRPRRP